MRHILLVLLAVCLALGSAVAQPAPADAPPAEAAIDVFLEQRVADELAAEGTLLSRRGVELDVELIGDRLLISLVDLATRRALASTKLDAIPPDREAAVASVTQLVASLVRQVDAGKPPVVAGDTAAAVVEMLAEDREERRREAEETRRLRKVDLLYDDEALSLGDEYNMFAFATTSTTGRTTNTTLHFGTVRRWTVYQGRTRERLSGLDFYRLLGREDLEDAYNARKRNEWIAVGIGTVLLGAGMYLALGPGRPGIADPSSVQPCVDGNVYQCEIGLQAKQDQLDRTAGQYRTAAYITFGGSLLAGFVGMYYWLNPHPISEREAASLAREYNGSLRNRLDRTVRLGDTALRDVRLAPTVSLGGGGLQLSGRF